MFIPQLLGGCLALLFVMTVQAEAYKWIDDDGEIIYSQTPPVDKPYETLETPPPPTLVPQAANKEIEMLIEQQAEMDKVREEQRQQQLEMQKAAANQAENCRVANYNLQQYQDNPGRRAIDSQGNITRPTEVERQNKITTLKQQVKQFCQQEN